MLCCGRRWVGVDRAHCCRRTADAVTSSTTLHSGTGTGTGTGAADAASIRDHWGLIPTIDGAWQRAPRTVCP